VLFEVTDQLPTTAPLSRDLPPLPDTTTSTWLLCVTKKQWNKVAHSLTTHREDKAICEGLGIPGAPNRLWVTSIKSLLLEKDKQEAQRQAAVGAGVA
jgi:hypothetical protein